MFTIFYIDPGGQKSHPGAPGSDSGGEKHQKCDFSEKWVFCVKSKRKYEKTEKPYGSIDIYICSILYIMLYIYIYAFAM